MSSSGTGSSVANYWDDKLTLFYISKTDSRLYFVQLADSFADGLWTEPYPVLTGSSANLGQRASAGVYAISTGSTVLLFFVQDGVWQYTLGKVAGSSGTQKNLSWALPITITNMSYYNVMISAQIYQNKLFVLFATAEGGQLAYLTGDLDKVSEESFLEVPPAYLGGILWSGPGSVLVGNKIYAYYKGKWTGSQNPIWIDECTIKVANGVYTLESTGGGKTHDATSNTPWPIYYGGNQYYAFSSNRDGGELWWAEGYGPGSALTGAQAMQYQTPSATVIGSTLCVFYLQQQTDKLQYFYQNTDGAWSSAQTVAYRIQDGAMVAANPVHVMGSTPAPLLRA